MRPSTSATRAAPPSIGTDPRNGVNVTEGVEGGLVGVIEGGGVTVGVGVAGAITWTEPFIAVPPGTLWT